MTSVSLNITLSASQVPGQSEFHNEALCNLWECVFFLCHRIAWISAVAPDSRDREKRKWWINMKSTRRFFSSYSKENE